MLQKTVHRGYHHPMFEVTNEGNTFMISQSFCICLRLEELLENFSAGSVPVRTTGFLSAWNPACSRWSQPPQTASAARSSCRNPSRSSPGLPSLNPRRRTWSALPFSSLCPLERKNYGPSALPLHPSVTEAHPWPQRLWGRPGTVTKQRSTEELTFSREGLDGQWSERRQPHRLTGLRGLDRWKESSPAFVVASGPVGFLFNTFLVKGGQMEMLHLRRTVGTALKEGNVRVICRDLWLSPLHHCGSLLLLTSQRCFLKYLCDVCQCFKHSH